MLLRSHHIARDLNRKEEVWAGLTRKHWTARGKSRVTKEASEPMLSQEPTAKGVKPNEADQRSGPAARLIILRRRSVSCSSVRFSGLNSTP